MKRADDNVERETGRYFEYMVESLVTVEFGFREM